MRIATADSGAADSASAAAAVSDAPRSFAVHVANCVRAKAHLLVASSAITQRQRIRLPTYKLTSTPAIRGDLRSWGLSDSGSRDELISRHRSYVHAFNANQDALVPLHSSEVLSGVTGDEVARTRDHAEAARVGRAPLPADAALLPPLLTSAQLQLERLHATVVGANALSPLVGGRAAVHLGIGVAGGSGADAETESSMPAAYADAVFEADDLTRSTASANVSAISSASKSSAFSFGAQLSGGSARTAPSPPPPPPVPLGRDARPPYAPPVRLPSHGPDRGPFAVVTRDMRASFRTLAAETAERDAARGSRSAAVVRQRLTALGVRVDASAATAAAVASRPLAVAAAAAALAGAPATVAPAAVPRVAAGVCAPVASTQSKAPSSSAIVTDFATAAVRAPPLQVAPGTWFPRRGSAVAPGDYRVVTSTVTGTPFFFNAATGVGQFKQPIDLTNDPDEAEVVEVEDDEADALHGSAAAAMATPGYQAVAHASAPPTVIGPGAVLAAAAAVAVAHGAGEAVAPATGHDSPLGGLRRHDGDVDRASTGTAASVSGSRRLKRPRSPSVSALSARNATHDVLRTDLSVESSASRSSATRSGVAGAAVAPPPLRGGTRWNCATCTLENPSRKKICEACGTRRQSGGLV